MKILRWIIIICFVLFGLLFVFVEFTIKFHGKEIIVHSLNEAFDRQTTLNKVRYIFPSAIFIEHVEVPAAFSAKGAKITLDFPNSVSQRKLVLREVLLIDPQFYVEKRPGPRYVWGVFASGKFSGGPGTGHNFGESSMTNISDCFKPPEDDPGKDETVKKDQKQEEDLFIDLMDPLGQVSSLGISVDFLKVIEGIVHFVDYSQGEERAVKVDFEDIFLRVQKFVLPPRFIKTNIDCTGVISGEGFFLDQSWFEASGSVNLKAKNMKMQLKVIDPNGVINLFTKMNAINNDMSVDGKFSIKGSLSEDKLDSFQASSFGDFLMVAVQKSRMDVDLDFSFKTKMDDFKIEKVNISGDLGIQGAVSLK